LDFFDRGAGTKTYIPYNTAAALYRSFAFYVLKISFGLDKSLSVIQMDVGDYRELLKLRLVHMTCVTLGQCVVEVSVCLFLLRLVARLSHTWVLYGLIIFLSCFTVVSFYTIGTTFHGLTSIKSYAYSLQ
jgi:hypothetical protein